MHPVLNSLADNEGERDKIKIGENIADNKGKKAQWIFPCIQYTYINSRNFGSTYIQETQGRSRGQWRGSKEEGSGVEEELWG